MRSITVKPHKKRKLLGIWDASLLPLLLGYQLIFVEQLLIKNIRSGCELIDICILNRSSRNIFYNTTPLIFKNFKDLNKVFFGKYETERTTQKKYFKTWNPFHYQHGKISLPSDTILIQDYFRRNGSIPHLYVKQEILTWVNNFYKKNLGKCLPIVVHLKNTADKKNLSNANLVEWYKFFKSCQKFENIKFILIGNENVGDQICELPNIIVTNHQGIDIGKDLAFIQTACFFMGMASGPSNMAIFNDVPYVIFKDPAHHKNEMQQELKNKDHFSFAKPYQKIICKLHDHRLLMATFLNLHKGVSKSDWQQRLKRIH